MLRLAPLLVLAALALTAPTLRAEDRIWSALILASNEEKPKDPPKELATLAGKIERVFGYNTVEIIGTATKTVDEETERWLVPTQNFWLCAKASRAENDGYLLKLKIYQDKRLLVETQAKLGANSPLLIKGPMHARGQLIIALKVEH